MATANRYEKGAMNSGITFDTGALIALERRSLRARSILERAIERKIQIVAPASVVSEWWRGRSDFREQILAAIRVEALSEALAKLAGEAIAAVKGATSVDAVVMASAALRGDVVYTSDILDLTRLNSFFPNVRVLRLD
jgi:predicted nucleic acid-binding protein